MPDSPSRCRRHHSSSFKAQVLQACAQPGASVASVALVHGINANLVHRWHRAAAEDGRTRRGNSELAEFVPMTLASPSVVAATEDIRIELRRGACAVSIAWFTSAATACAGWLRELLR